MYVAILLNLSSPDEEEDEVKAAVANQKEEFLSGFVQNLLPRVGRSVQTLSLAYGGDVDSDLVSHHQGRKGEGLACVGGGGVDATQVYPLVLVSGTANLTNVGISRSQQTVVKVHNMQHW